MFSTIGYAICIPFAALLRLFYNLTGSYGVSLILFTLVIKLILLPFQMKSKKSMVRMSRMSGKMQEIQKKYANNQVKLQEEMQKFYQEEGFNPMSGCLWSFLPLPILMALYYIIRDPIVYFMNFGGKEAGLEVVEAARQLIEGAGIQIQASVGYEQIAIANIINSQFPDFIAEHPGWITVDYHFLGVDLIQTPWSGISALSQGVTPGPGGPDPDPHHLRPVQLPAEQGDYEAERPDRRQRLHQDDDVDDAPDERLHRLHRPRRPGRVLGRAERVLPDPGGHPGQVLHQ